MSEARHKSKQKFQRLGRDEQEESNIRIKVLTNIIIETAREIAGIKKRKKGEQKLRRGGESRKRTEYVEMNTNSWTKIKEVVRKYKKKSPLRKITKQNKSLK